jgi:hypothetical protein
MVSLRPFLPDFPRFPEGPGLGKPFPSEMDLAATRLGGADAEADF